MGFKKRSEVTTTSNAGGLIMPLWGVVVFPPEGGV